MSVTVYHWTIQSLCFRPVCHFVIPFCSTQNVLVLLLFFLLSDRHTGELLWYCSLKEKSCKHITPTAFIYFCMCQFNDMRMIYQHSWPMFNESCSLIGSRGQHHIRSYDLWCISQLIHVHETISQKINVTMQRPRSPPECHGFHITWLVEVINTALTYRLIGSLL